MLSWFFRIVQQLKQRASPYESYRHIAVVDDDYPQHGSSLQAFPDLKNRGICLKLRDAAAHDRSQFGIGGATRGHRIEEISLSYQAHQLRPLIHNTCAVNPALQESPPRDSNWLILLKELIIMSLAGSDRSTDEKDVPMRDSVAHF